MIVVLGAPLCALALAPGPERVPLLDRLRDIAAREPQDACIQYGNGFLVDRTEHALLAIVEQPLSPSNHGCRAKAAARALREVAGVDALPRILGAASRENVAEDADQLSGVQVELKTTYTWIRLSTTPHPENELVEWMRGGSNSNESREAVALATGAYQILKSAACARVLETVLLRALRSRSPVIRNLQVHIGGDCERADWLPVVVPMLTDPSADVRMGAAYALCSFARSDMAAVGVLRSRANAGPPNRLPPERKDAFVSCLTRRGYSIAEEQGLLTVTGVLSPLGALARSTCYDNALAARRAQGTKSPVLPAMQCHHQPPPQMCVGSVPPQYCVVADELHESRELLGRPEERRQAEGDDR